MRTIAFSTLSYSNRSLEEALEAAARFGLPDVDLGALEGWVHVYPSRVAENPEATVSEVKRLCDETGTRIVSLNAAFGRAPSDAAEGERRLLETEALGLFCRELGARVVTVQPGPLPSPEEIPRALGVAARNLRSMVDILEEYNVRLLIEPHVGGLCQEPEDALSLVEDVPGLGITYDPSHFVCAEIPFERTQCLFPKVGHVHLRDASPGEMQMAWREGRVDFERVILHLNETGYEGIISIEYIGVEDHPENVEGPRDWLEHRWLIEE